MKILAVDPAHCLSLALVAVTQDRLDIELVQHEMSTVETLDISDVDAVLVPPLVHLDTLSDAIIDQHAQEVETLIDLCHSVDCALVWCVSDEIYEDGYADGAIEESLIPKPVSPSRQRLVEVGDRIRAELKHFLMIRTGPLFGLKGKGAWLPSLLEGMYTGHNILAENDLYVGPTPVDALARGICGMLLQLYNGANSWGAYHFSGIEPVSVYTFVKSVRAQLEHQLEAHHHPTDRLGEVEAIPYRRGPVRRVLNCRHMLGTFGVHQKPWRLEIEKLTALWVEMRLAISSETL